MQFSTVFLGLLGLCYSATFLGSIDRYSSQNDPELNSSNEEQADSVSSLSDWSSADFELAANQSRECSRVVANCKQLITFIDESIVESIAYEVFYAMGSRSSSELLHQILWRTFGDEIVDRFLYNFIRSRNLSQVLEITHLVAFAQYWISKGCLVNDKFFEIKWPILKHCSAPILDSSFQTFHSAWHKMFSVQIYQLLQDSKNQQRTSLTALYGLQDLVSFMDFHKPLTKSKEIRVISELNLHIQVALLTRPTYGTHMSPPYVALRKMIRSKADRISQMKVICSFNTWDLIRQHLKTNGAIPLSVSVYAYSQGLQNRANWIINTILNDLIWRHHLEDMDLGEFHHWTTMSAGTLRQLTSQNEHVTDLSWYYANQLTMNSDDKRMMEYASKGYTVGNDAPPAHIPIMVYSALRSLMPYLRRLDSKLPTSDKSIQTVLLSFCAGQVKCRPNVAPENWMKYFTAISQAQSSIVPFRSIAMVAISARVMRVSSMSITSRLTYLGLDQDDAEMASRLLSCFGGRDEKPLKLMGLVTHILIYYQMKRMQVLDLVWLERYLQNRFGISTFPQDLRAFVSRRLENGEITCALFLELLIAISLHLIDAQHKPILYFIFVRLFHLGHGKKDRLELVMKTFSYDDPFVLQAIEAISSSDRNEFAMFMSSLL